MSTLHASAFEVGFIVVTNSRLTLPTSFSGFKGIEFNKRLPLELPGLPFPRGAPGSSDLYETYPRFEESDVEKVNPDKIFYLPIVSIIDGSIPRVS